MRIFIVGVAVKPIVPSTTSVHHYSQWLLCCVARHVVYVSWLHGQVCAVLPVIDPAACVGDRLLMVCDAQPSVEQV